MDRLSRHVSVKNWWAQGLIEQRVGIPEDEDSDDCELEDEDDLDLSHPQRTDAVY
jgi:hypothetical protein